MTMKCEVINFDIECGKEARFRIIDFECGNEQGDYEVFWVCNDCIHNFIDKNEDNPHYILLEVRK